MNRAAAVPATTARWCIVIPVCVRGLADRRPSGDADVLGLQQVPVMRVERPDSLAPPEPLSSSTQPPHRSTMRSMDAWVVDRPGPVDDHPLLRIERDDLEP